ncbi:MAG: hypothetical protein B7Y40_04325 [Gammaproteobacteria bacterium 28-57-27]|nr:MAG: hypothetical protein B7Y40_04325 [Gammaproteobacteria bacterium 28-57-27]
MLKLENIANNVIDTIEKVSSPASRAGSVIERAGRMREEGVDSDVIALQMSKNSPNYQTYTTRDVEGYSKLYQDSKTKVTITSKQARALIKDQYETNPAADDLISQS